MTVVPPRYDPAVPVKPTPMVLVSAETRIRPFLKWAGGKQWLVEYGIKLPALSPHATYFEPFLGGGSIFFALQPERAVLADSNSELIATYRAVRSNVADVIRLLSSYKNDRKTFDRVVRSRPTSLAGRAARLIYLNKTAFNGLYRVNRLGEFNVPFGRYKAPTICSEDRLLAASKALKNASIRTVGYRGSVRSAQQGDLVYFDPPYVTGHNNNGFLKYNAHLFRWSDQQNLALVARELRDRGVHVVLTNAAHDAVLELYEGFQLNVLQRTSLIGGPVETRGPVREALISTFPT